MYILSREEMYWCDHYTIENLKIPGKELMENAGRGSAEYIRDHLLADTGSRILVYCGSGNNGGDGFVIARYLREWGFGVEIVYVSRYEKMSQESRENYDSCENLGIKIHQVYSYEDWKGLEIDISSYTLVVDAIFGVGLKGDLRGWLVNLIAEINASAKQIVAIDIPSGIDAETGSGRVAIAASHTLTMAAVKYGLLLGAGKSSSGIIEVIDIGMPEEVLKLKGAAGRILQHSDVILPERKAHYHKGNYGRIAIIAGSAGYTGAAVLASRAALRCGAGLITLFHPAGLETIFEIKLLEVMSRVLPESEKELLAELSDFDAVLFGPGVGRGALAKDTLKALVKGWNKPLVIDADGINLLSENKDLIADLKGREVLLTPHIGEFSRLLGISINEVLQDRVNLLMSFCAEMQLKVVLIINKFFS